MRRLLTLLSTVGSLALTAHTVVNLRQLRTPPATPLCPDEPVSVLLPLRNEARRVEPGLRALIQALDYCRNAIELVVLDDESDDGTADVVRRVVGDDPRVRVMAGATPPPGWLGKTWACQQLSAAADPQSAVYVFVDADVVLAPHALASAVAQLRESGLDLVCPYPRQEAHSPAERLVQPLLQWSWLTTLPLRRAESSPRPSLSAANGQFLVIDAAAYRRAGAHAAVRGAVLDDLALVRAVKSAGGTGGVTDGTHLATCRMYDGWPALREGYTKSLWSAFGSPIGSAGVVGGLSLLYIWPVAALVTGSRLAWLSYASGVAGRVLVARRTGARVWPDCLAHPLSVAMLGWLTAQSWRGRRRATLTWKGRQLPGPAGAYARGERA